MSKKKLLKMENKNFVHLKEIIQLKKFFVGSAVVLNIQVNTL
jgi:hypothetical protein